MGAEKWNELGRVHAGWAEWAAAQECFEAAITTEPRWPALWANLALAAARNGDTATAEGALQMADTLQPERAARWRQVVASGHPLPIGALRLEVRASSEVN
jgi:tetratricopeptide (TPR) repeat protein